MNYFYFILNLFINIIVILEKRCNKQLSSSTASGITKKQRENGRNKENAIEIIDADEGSQLD